MWRWTCRLKRKREEKLECSYLMAYDFLSHKEGEVTCLSDECDNFRRMVMVQTTNVKNEKES